MLEPVILPDLFSAISLPVLAAGVTPCALPDGPRTDLFGRAVAPANPLAQPVPGGALQTNATSGPPGSILSASADLTLFLVSKLKQRLTTDGSILFKLTWKEKVTPAGRLVCRLAASGRRISDSDCGSWPTPNTMEGGQTSRGGKRKGELLMGGLVGWVSPRAQDGERGGSMSEALKWAAGDPRPSGAQRGTSLTEQTQLIASWPTASARAWKDTTGMATTGTNPDGSTRSRLDQLPRVAGLTAIGSPAVTEKPGQLNPAHSRWLMGLPPEWDACAPTATPSSRKSRKSL